MLIQIKNSLNKKKQTNQSGMVRGKIEKKMVVNEFIYRGNTWNKNTGTKPEKKHDRKKKMVMGKIEKKNDGK